MKRFTFILLVLVTGVLLTSCLPTVYQAVDLPGPVEDGITSLVVLGVSWLFVQLITLVPFLAFLDQYKMPLALGIASALIQFVENNVPDLYGNVAIAGIVFLLALFELVKVFAKKQTPGFRAR